MTLALLIALLSGCTVVNTECDWTRDLRFGSQQTIDWLLENDRPFLVGAVTHNETRERLCK